MMLVASGVIAAEMVSSWPLSSRMPSDKGVAQYIIRIC